MSIPLLTTKLNIPPLRQGLVSRPRLIERLNVGLQKSGPGNGLRFARKLTLVSAPAGYGKTTLLSECAASYGRLEPTMRFAWLSLDERDNDPARFLAYLIAALQTGEAGVVQNGLGVVQSPQPSPIEATLTTLINEIGERPISTVLVLDDYHLIEAQPIHDALNFLLEHLPPQMHLILSTRADPPLLLSRLRGRGQLGELRTDDLRFTVDEAAAFLNQAMGLALSAEDVVALEARTEGWIVGLQMVALALQGTGSMGRADAGRVARFIAAFTGSHRYVLDYLADEVLSRQPKEIQRFLLQTAILDRLTAPLCDQVTGGDNGSARFTPSGQQVLEQLDAANLFIVPLDGERRWYRYHPLFADLLRSRLAQTQPDQVSKLHLRASEWYEANNLLPDAVGHAFAAGDVERVARLVSGHTLAMMEHGQLTTLKGWLDGLSGDVVRSHPWLCIGLAWVSVLAGKLDAVESLLQDAAKSVEHSTAASVMTEGEIRQINGHVAAVRASVAFVRGDEAQTAELARAALELLPAEDSVTRGWAAIYLGLTSYQSSDLGAADQALSEAVAIGQGSGHSHVAVWALTNLAALQMDRGRLFKAGETLRHALQLAEEYADRTGHRLPTSAIAHTYLGVLLSQWNRTDAALEHLRTGVELSERRGEPLRLAASYLHLAAVLQSMGDTDGALDAIDKAKRAAANSLSPWIAARVARVEALVCLQQGDTEAASRWATMHQEGLDDYIDQVDYWSGCLVHARIHRVQGRLAEALGLLAQVSEAAEAAGGIHYLIGSLTLQAIVLQEQGRLDRALATLERALSLAEPEGYVRIFIDEGEPVAQLLRQAAARGLQVSYVCKLLAAFTETAPLSPSMTEPLSERELEVLRLLAAGLSNREIGEQLFLAVGTVKKYTSNIYGKLGVHKRTLAVARARELGLL